MDSPSIKSKSVKPKGKKSAYNLYLKAYSDELKKQNPNQKASIKELSQGCSQSWKKMSEKEKRPYINLAENDKKRYDKEMENYKPNENEIKTRKTKSEKKPKDGPKRALSSYIYFANAERENVKMQNPDLKLTEITKILGQQWRSASQTVKARFEQMAAKDKKRYERELEEYKQGTFVGPTKTPTKSKSKKKEPVKQKELSESDDSISENNPTSSKESPENKKEESDEESSSEEDEKSEDESSEED